MSRQGRRFPKAVSSIISSHQPASRVRISLTLTDNWKCCIIFSSSPAFVPPYYGHILGRHTSLTSIIAEVVGMAPVEECEHEIFVLIQLEKAPACRSLDATGGYPGGSRHPAYCSR